MASVAAIRPNGSAVSTLTNPDGTYEINGIPPGTYLVYAEPLPPTANIILPKDADGNDVNAFGPFDGLFYPNATDFKSAATVAVRAGASTGGINFSVNPRRAVPVYDVSTYSFYGQ